MNRELLYSFFSRQASVEQEKQIIDWLEQDPAHRQEMLNERKLYDEILLLADESVLYAKQPKRLRVGWAKQTIRYAAIIAFAVGINSYYLSHVYRQITGAPTP